MARGAEVNRSVSTGLPAVEVEAPRGDQVATGSGDVAVRTTRNIAATAVSQVVSKAGTLAWTLVAARQLTTEEFGLFNLALSIALLVSAFAEWGFDPVLVRRASQRPELLNRHYAEAVSWQSAVGIPVFLAGGVAMAMIRPDAAARWTVTLLLIAVFVDLWSDTGRAASAAAFDQTGTATALVVHRLVTMALAVPVLLAGGGTVALAAAVLAAYLAGWVAHQLALRRLGVRFHPRLVTRAGMRDFARGTWVVGLNALVLMALFRIDAVLLGEMAGERALGAYAAAYRLFESALFVTFAVTSAAYPLMSARARAGPAVRRGVETGMAVAAAAYLPFAAVCLVNAPGVLDLLFGGDYGRTAANSLRWLALAPFAFAAAYLASAALTATGRARALFIGAVLALVTNVSLNLFLIPRFAGAGAGFATTASYVVEAAVLFIGLSRTSGRVRVGRPLLESAIAATALAIALWLSPLHTAVEVPVGVLCYLGLWWGLTRHFDPEHLQVLREAAPRRRR